jgi:phosphate acetyltransferase
MLSNHTSKTKGLSPNAFRQQLIVGAVKADRHIVLPEGEEPRTLSAAQICIKKNIARLTLLGKKDKIYHAARTQGLKLHASINIVDPDRIAERYIDSLFQMRQHKNMTRETARDALKDKVMLGTMMLYHNDVDGLVSGAVHSSANTVRPALQIIKMKPNVALVSSVFFMCLPNVSVYGDCGVNLNPNAKELADIAIQSAQTAQAFGIAPRIAMLSYSSGTSGKGKDVDRVQDATTMVKQLRPDLLIDGPLQYDAASVPEVAKQKVPNSPLKGHSTVFIFPDLDAGNITYKAVQRSANIVSIGPILQGLNKPVNDLSRGASVDDILYTIAVTAIQAVQ